MSNIQIPEAVQRVVHAINAGESTTFVTVEGDRVASFRIPSHA